MDTKFESAVKVVSASAEMVYNRLSDFTKLEAVFPTDKISDWSSTADSCRFSIDKIGEVGLRIVERELNSVIKYSADGRTPFLFNLWVQMKEVAPYDSRLKVTIKADMNPMMKMVASGPVQKLVDSLAEAMSKYQY